MEVATPAHPALIAFTCWTFASVLAVFPDEFWAAMFEMKAALVWTPATNAATYMIVLLLVAYGHACVYVRADDFIEVHIIYTACFGVFIVVHWTALSSLGAAVSTAACAFVMAALLCEAMERELTLNKPD